MDAMAEIRLTFFEECDEQLSELGKGLDVLNSGDVTAETIGVVFRAVHSVKGGAGAFHLKDLVRFALTFESVLNEIRSDRLVLGPDVMALLRRSASMLRDLVAVARDRDTILAELRAYIPGAEAEAAGEDEAEGEPAAEDAGPPVSFDFTPVSVDWEDILEARERRFRIFLKPRPELYANANESARLIREVAALGTAEITCDTEETPLLADLTPEGAFLSWTIDLTTTEGEGAIREIFDFAAFDCDLDITALDEEPEAGGAGTEDGAMDPDVAALFARLQAAE